MCYCLSLASLAGPAWYAHNAIDDATCALWRRSNAVPHQDARVQRLADDFTVSHFDLLVHEWYKCGICDWPSSICSRIHWSAQMVKNLSPEFATRWNGQFLKLKAEACVVAIIRVGHRLGCKDTFCSCPG